MATDAERAQFKRLAGKHLPDGDTPGVDYTDDEANAYLAAAPACPLLNGGGADVYGAAANAWEDKAEQLEIAAVAAGGDSVLVKQVGQADASVVYARPVGIGATTTKANDPDSIRQLLRRLRLRSCNGGRFRSVTVLPPDVVTPGSGGLDDYDGMPYTDPRPLILDNADNPDQVINLPEVD